MKQPKGFIKKGEENLVCKLKKSIYGLKQSPRCWNDALDTHLKEIGFVQSTSGPCIYMVAGGDLFYIEVYVDDIVLAARSEERIKEVKGALSAKFDIKDMGILHHFLGMSVVQDEAQGHAWIGQPTYTENLLECKTANLLVIPSVSAQSLKRPRMKKSVSMNSCIILQLEA